MKLLSRKINFFLEVISIVDHPADPIDIDCKKYGRSGRYRKAVLLKTFGSDIELAYLIGLLTGDFEYTLGPGDQGCGGTHPTVMRGLSMIGL